jgi:transposase InsO family protein
MPWMEKKLSQQRLELISLARQPGANHRQLCLRFGVSRKTLYKWLRRASGEPKAEELEDRSRRPKHSPQRTAEAIEQQVLALRAQEPAWGPRKLKRRLEDLGATALPARSTFGIILRRAGLIAPEVSAQHRPWQHFVRERANELWQMDFKGDVALSRGGRCHPLPLLDDHSRYVVGLFACGNQRERTVRAHLEAAFERYGLPEELLCDNGTPWSGNPGEWTRLEVWLLRQGTRLTHGRPYHPQTQGKEERLNQTLKRELLSRHDLRDLAHAQELFDEWRLKYNCHRPHDSLDLDVPAKHFQVSPRRYQAKLPEIEYEEGLEVRRVKSKGEITWRNRSYFVGSAFAGENVALQPTRSEHRYEVRFAHVCLGEIDLRQSAKSKHHYITIRARTRAPKLPR